MVHRVWSKGFVSTVVAITVVAATGLSCCTVTALADASGYSKLTQDAQWIGSYLNRNDPTGYGYVQTLVSSIRGLNSTSWDTIVYGTSPKPAHGSDLSGAIGAIIGIPFTSVTGSQPTSESDLVTQLNTAGANASVTFSASDVDNFLGTLQSEFKSRAASVINGNTPFENALAASLAAATLQTQQFNSLFTGYGFSSANYTSTFQGILSRFKNAISNNAAYAGAKTALLEGYAHLPTSTGGGTTPTPTPPTTGTTPGFDKPITSGTVSSSGGQITGTSGNTAVQVDVPTGAFDGDVKIDLTTGDVSQVKDVPAGLQPTLTFGINFSGSNPKVPITITITNPDIPDNALIFKQTDKGLIPVKATISNGKVVLSITSDPNFVVVIPHESTLKPGQRGIYFNGSEVAVVPGIVKNNTTYMPVWYVMHALNGAGFTSTWDGRNWHLTTPQGTSVDLTKMNMGKGDMNIYLNGTLVHKVYGLYVVDPSTKQLTTYMPVWYVMEILKRAGVTSTWDGSRWHMTVYPS